MKNNYKEPESSKIIIFGNENNTLISLLNTSNIPYEVYDIENKTLDINLSFIFTFIINLIRNISEVDGVKKYISNNYHLTKLNLKKPRVVITNIDNNTIFHWLSRKLNSKCIAIQNGLRTNYEFDSYYDNHIKNYSHDIYCALNDHELLHLKKKGVSINHSLAIGSLRLGMYLENRPIMPDIQYDICLISEYFTDVKTKYAEELKNYIEQVYLSLSKYIRRNDKSIIIAMNDSDSITQKKYFKKLFPNAKFSNTVKNEYASYDSICQSKLTVAFFSTMILETISLGKKALAIDYSDSDTYFDYDDSIKFTKRDYLSFERSINEILASTNEEYLSRINLDNKELVLNHEILPQNIVLNLLRDDLLS